MQSDAAENNFWPFEQKYNGTTETVTIPQNINIQMDGIDK